MNQTLHNLKQTPPNAEHSIKAGQTPLRAGAGRAVLPLSDYLHLCLNVCVCCSSLSNDSSRLRLRSKKVSSPFLSQCAAAPHGCDRFIVIVIGCLSWLGVGHSGGTHTGTVPCCGGFVSAGYRASPLSPASAEGVQHNVRRELEQYNNWFRRSKHVYGNRVGTIMRSGTGGPPAKPDVVPTERLWV